MKKVKALFFDIDDTLYDSTLQAEMVRRNAIKAMIEAGLNIDEEKCLDALKDIVKKFGSNYQHHFNELLKKFDYDENPRIIAAGIVAYHTTKLAYLVPFADTIPTLLALRERGYKLGIITDGIAVKQWEKLIRLGLQHFFHAVIISEEIKKEKSDPEMFKLAAKKINCNTNEVVMVGDRLNKDILGANKAGMITVQIMKGKYKDQKPESKEEEPDYIISSLREILKVLETRKFLQ